MPETLFFCNSGKFEKCRENAARMAKNLGKSRQFSKFCKRKNACRHRKCCFAAPAAPNFFPEGACGAPFFAWGRLWRPKSAWKGAPAAPQKVPGFRQKSAWITEDTRTAKKKTISLGACMDHFSEVISYWICQS